MTVDRRRRETFAERRERRGAVEDVAVVLDAAARYLETRSRSVAEVRRRLTSAGYRKTLVDTAIERLVELGFLDDEAFARAWVESRDRARPRGEQALRRELRLRGVDPALVDSTLAGRRGEDEESAARDEEDADRDPEVDAARRLVERRRAALAREADPRRRRSRVYALLARNGFSPDIAAQVSREVVAPEWADVQIAGVEDDDGG